MSATPSNVKTLSRRKFLEWLGKLSLAGSAMFGLGALGRFISFESEASPPSEIDLGPESDYPSGVMTPVPGAQAVIIHTDQGYKALSLVCPHLGCAVKVTSDGFACPCHGSRFLQDGSLRNGPSSHPLTTLRVELNSEGHLILYTQ